MKYDATDLPASYDRARARSPEVLALWMNAVEAATEGSGPIRRILDLGCGTGRFSAALRAHFGADVVGIDPSHKMLSQAVAKARVGGSGAGAKSRGDAAHDTHTEGGTGLNLIGRGEDIPVRNGSVDLVYMSMVFHHFTDPSRVVAECRRVLRDGGVAFLRAGTRDRIPSYPPSRFFPASVPIMERVLVPAVEIAHAFETASLRSVAAGQLEQQIAPTFAAYAEQLAAGADSVLAQLDADQMAAGLAALREHAARVDPAPVSELIDFFAFQRPHPGR